MPAAFYLCILQAAPVSHHRAAQTRSEPWKVHASKMLSHSQEAQGKVRWKRYKLPLSPGASSQQSQPLQPADGMAGEIPFTRAQGVELWSVGSKDTGLPPLN